ncbi:MAG: hypothetical protein RBT62_09300 [Spirochaetia bacterium]|nr:hypothetical protein [Spirochaetia bacterium]
MTIRRVTILAVVAAVLLASCATKPPVAPEPEPVIVEPAPEVPTTPQIAREDIEALHGRVLALRKEAFELGLKDSMDKEYAVAEERYLAGKKALDADDRPIAKTELGAAEPLFADLVSKGVVMVAESRQTDANAARSRAMAAYADIQSPKALSTADAAMAMADVAFAAGDSKAAIEAYIIAITAYDAVEKRSTATSVKKTIDDLAYAPMDAGNYEIAGQKLARVDELLAQDARGAQDAAEEALLRYRLVLAKGWELTAGSNKDSAEKAKTEAETIKAQVAVQTEYAEAKAAYDEAVAAYSSGDHELAAALFNEAEFMLNAAYESAAEKRSAALAAMEAAQLKSGESASIAEQADETLAGTAGKDEE